MSTPHWLTAYATSTGNDPALLGTRAVPRHCRRCRLVVLAGYDSPLCGGLAICDPHPLSPQLEAAAVILGRATYRLWGAPGRYELTRRTPVQAPLIALPRAGPDVLVLAAHRCGTPPLTREHLPAPPTFAVDSDGPPPF